MEFAEYQERAEEANQVIPPDDDRALHAALFGLGSETGTLFDIQKKLLTGKLDAENGLAEAREELGDLLWYLSRVAGALGIPLEEIAEHNLSRVADMWKPTDLPELDGGAMGERFPRLLRFRFDEVDYDEGDRTLKRAKITLIEAVPNDYPDGPLQVGVDENGNAKFVGYALGAELGAELDDNSKRVNGYRYHDAIHMAFMARLHWSATMRSLLRVKRKSDPDKDAHEDSARPIFLEEGLAAVLAALAPRRLNFETYALVDGDVLAAVKACTRDLESSVIPARAWRDTITEAFSVMKKLVEHSGGYVVADLEARTLSYEPF